MNTASRRAEVVRNTRETQIRVVVDLDGTGRAELATGIGFMETDAIKFYNEAAEKTRNPVGKKMFLTIAEDVKKTSRYYLSDTQRTERIMQGF